DAAATSALRRGPFDGFVHLRPGDAVQAELAAFAVGGADRALTTTPAKHRGSCHCGAVRFEVALNLAGGLSRCNYTICTKIGSTGTCVKPEAFTLLAGEPNLGIYAWGGKISVRYFCK